MGKYFLLKLKSLIKVFPYVTIAVFLLFGSLLTAFAVVYESSNDEKTRFKLALVCSESDPYFMAGLEVVQGYDSTRFSIETQHMSEEEAQKALEQGRLDAYVIIPDGYIGSAMQGELSSLKYVSTTSSADLTTLFKDEITGVVSNIIITCEKSMYGIEAVAQDFDFQQRAANYTYAVSLSYVDYILDRSDMYFVDQLGLHDSLGFDGYLFSGIAVLLISVMLIPVALCFINREFAVLHLLKSKNIGAGKQVFAEFMALVTALILPVCGLGLITSIFRNKLPEDVQRLAMIFFAQNIWHIFLIVMTLGAFAYFVVQLADELVGGTLLYFFTALVLCFVSGCIYPVYFFPDVLRNVAQYTPQGLGRQLIGNCIVGSLDFKLCVNMMLYSSLFLIGAVCIRIVRLRRAKR